MKTILCYGDSLTWGLDAETGGRHPHADRWPSVLQKVLGNDVQIVTDGLNGRTTAYDDDTAVADRNGARVLPTVLSTHAPLELVIIMLGTNDMKNRVAGRAIDARTGMQRLVEIIRHHAWPLAMEAPEILIVAPPVVQETGDPIFAATFAGASEESKMLASYYADLADETGCGFYDASGVSKTTPLDGVHLDVENTRAIGKGLAPIVRVMLGL